VRLVFDDLRSNLRVVSSPRLVPVNSSWMLELESVVWTMLLMVLVDPELKVILHAGSEHSIQLLSPSFTATYRSWFLVETVPWMRHFTSVGVVLMKNLHYLF
jgi:hypothetical protein